MNTVWKPQLIALLALLSASLLAQPAPVAPAQAQQIAPVPAAPAPSLDALLAQADSLANSGQIELARQMWNQILQTAPAAPVAPAALLHLAQHEQDLTNALALTDRLLATYPQSAEVEQALALQGEVHFLMGNYESATNVYSDYLRRYPTGSAAALAEDRLITSHIETNHPREALTEWDRAAVTQPQRTNDVNALMQRAEALLAVGDTQTAAASYLDIVNRFPNSDVLPRAHLAAGLCLESLNRWPEALPVYEALMRRWPQSSEARLAGDRSLAIRRFLTASQAMQ
jgi:TolA-binding protein